MKNESIDLQAQNFCQIKVKRVELVLIKIFTNLRPKHLRLFYLSVAVAHIWIPVDSNRIEKLFGLNEHRPFEEKPF